jgi:hypothetical protein
VLQCRTLLASICMSGVCLGALRAMLAPDLWARKVERI